VFLGVSPSDGDPEESIDTETDAFAVLAGANGSGLGISMLKAQLLAAKLNSLAFPGFADAYLPTGDRVADVIADADQILDDLANGGSHTKDEITHVKDLLDAANNNSNQQVLTTCSQPLVYQSSPGDFDGDGFDDEREQLIGTNSTLPCGTSGWPLDLVGGLSGSPVDIVDITSFLAPIRRLDTNPGDEAYDPRWDLVANQFGAAISIGDLTSLLAGPTAYPPMLGGERALNATCPYAGQ
jgi:hypothetical protein